MEEFFGMQKSHLSAVIHTFSEGLLKMALPYLSDPTIFRDRMPLYANAISEKCNNLLDNVWGFIDGTVRKTCRPLYFQNSVIVGIHDVMD